MVFPQGPATPTGSLTKIYDSAAVVASRCNARIVPVRTDNQRAVLDRRAEQVAQLHAAAAGTDVIAI